MDLAALGEFGLIEAIRRRSRVDRRVWRLGIGDDAAVLRVRAREELVFAADGLVEDVHFRWSTTDGRSLGEKSLAVNLSDLGAMGATPLGCLLTLGVPAEAAPERLDGFVSGLLACARARGCPLVGGGTVRSPVWSIGISVVGAVAPNRALLRSGARAGDRILVTGALGGAAAGLARVSTRLGLDPLALALAGGEDSELLFAAPKSGPSAAALARRLGCPVTEIGVFARGRGVHFTRAGRPYALESAGFAHFKPAPRNSEK